MAKHKFARGFLLGGAIGGIAALLLAPRSGKKTRKQLCKSYHETVDSVCDQTIEFAEQLEDMAKKCRKKLK